MDIEADQHQNDARIAKSKLWTASNVFSVLAMGVGSIGYGYSANVIAPILGMDTFVSRMTAWAEDNLAFQSFNEYFGLQTRANGTAILAAMTASKDYAIAHNQH